MNDIINQPITARIDPPKEIRTVTDAKEFITAVANRDHDTIDKYTTGAIVDIDTKANSTTVTLSKGAADFLTDLLYTELEETKDEGMQHLHDHSMGSPLQGCETCADIDNRLAYVEEAYNAYHNSK